MNVNQIATTRSAEVVDDGPVDGGRDFTRWLSGLRDTVIGNTRHRDNGRRKWGWRCFTAEHQWCRPGCQGLDLVAYNRRYATRFEVIVQINDFQQGRWSRFLPRS